LVSDLVKENGIFFSTKLNKKHENNIIVAGITYVGILLSIYFVLISTIGLLYVNSSNYGSGGESYISPTSANLYSFCDICSN
jgi:hypothetical protein